MSDCVKSVLMQDKADVEHVVMDGGSNDETVQILECLSSDSRLRWVSEPDGGQSDALNKAFSMSTGDWIGWLNADEFYLPGALARVIDCIEKNPKTDLIYGDFTEVDADGRLVRLVAEHDFSEKSLQSFSYIPSCTTFIKRNAMPARLWDIQCSSMMDWDLFLELYRAGKKFTHLKYPLAAFRIHPDQVTESSSAQSPEEFSLIRGRHGIPMGASALRTAKLVGRSAHIARKVVEGGYVREVRASRVKGHSLKWFEQVDPEALSSLGVRFAQTLGE
jgi:glycosyltransferase involved in cell wall biosynthesis